MLKATFCCFKGVSFNTEQRLWEEGFLSWNDVLRVKPRALSARKWDSLKHECEEANIALESGSVDYFLERLPPGHRVRVWPDFFDRLVALDIETNGFCADVLTIALHKRFSSSVYVKNVDLEQWKNTLEYNPVLVTYNGTHFDLPVLNACFDVILKCSHIDMMYELRAHGYRGGLKNCEKHLKIQRQYSDGMSGEDVFLLWRSWDKEKKFASIRQIVRYNMEDAVNLFKLGRKIYEISMTKYPVKIPLPQNTHLNKIEWFGA